MRLMINILKMEISRFFTNKMMYILLFIYVVFQVFGTFMFTQFEAVSPFNGVVVQDLNQGQYMQMVLAQSPSWVMLYIGIFTVSFYMSEYNNGFHKNYISTERARIHSVTSKIIVLGLFTLIIFGVMIFADFFSRLIFFENSSIGDIDIFLKIVLGQFLMHWAFVVVMLCITILLKRLIASIIVAVVLGLNVLGSIVRVLESLIHDGDFASYLLVNSIMTIRDYNEASELIHVLIVAGIYFIVFAAIAIRFKIKEDLH